MRFLAALSFLTIVPLPLRRKISPEEVGRSLHYFPLVGIIIGLILVGLKWLFVLYLPSAVVSGLLIAAMVLISGALHLEGFIDTCDGIAGHRTVEERLRVMHDSRVGAFGVIGAVLLLLVKYVSLSSVPEDWLTLTLLLVPLVSRWAMVYAVFAYPYARPSGLGLSFKQGASWQRLTLATIMTLAVVMLLLWWSGINHPLLGAPAILAVIWLMVAVSGTYLKRKFSGLSGDTYGAINEVVEAGVLVTIIVLTYNGWLSLSG